jgi:hypothetical protein
MGMTACAPIALVLKRGGDAFIVEYDDRENGDAVTLASSASSPPGSTVDASFASETRNVGVRVKVRGCRRDPLPDGRAGFRIEGRFISLTRGDREALFGSRDETTAGSSSET